MSIAKFNEAMKSENNDRLLKTLRKLQDAEEPLRPNGFFLWHAWF